VTNFFGFNPDSVRALRQSLQLEIVWAGRRDGALVEVAMDRSKAITTLSRAVILCGMLGSGCSEKAGAPACVGTARSALFGASTDSGTLKLAPAESAAIVSLEAGDGQLLCTGTRLADQWVLTAAHCAAAGPLFVRCAEIGFALPPQTSLSHPELDVMLLRHSAPAEACDACRASLEPWSGTLDNAWIGASVTLAGSGFTEEGSLGELRFVEEPIVEMHPTELWVNGRGRSGACGGDSGGPMLTRDVNGKVRLLGVLDRGSADCVGVDVYTRIDVLGNWIQRELR
jgi:hypothetical protein